MYISITVTSSKKSVDIQTDNLQKIEDVLLLLSETVGIELSGVQYLRSMIQKKVISAKNTFAEENIQSGDELVLLLNQ